MTPSPSPVGFPVGSRRAPHGVGADIVMQSIALIEPDERGFECRRQFSSAIAMESSAIRHNPPSFRVLFAIRRWSTELDSTGLSD